MKNLFSKLSILIILPCFVPVQAEQTLGAGELKELFSGNTVTAYSELNKTNVSLYYDQSGEVRGLFSNGKIGATRWWVKDSGLICLKSKKGDLCFEVLEKDDQYQKYLVKANGDRVLAFSNENFSSGNSNNY